MPSYRKKATRCEADGPFVSILVYRGSAGEQVGEV